VVKREAMDYLIRETLRQDVGEQEPSADVRGSLLAKAEAHGVQTEQVVGTSIPPLVNGLRDTSPIMYGSVRLPELEAELMEFFGSTQQRLVSIWLLASNTRY
jgi:hypothetical protein